MAVITKFAQQAFPRMMGLRSLIPTYVHRHVLKLRQQRCTHISTFRLNSSYVSKITSATAEKVSADDLEIKMAGDCLIIRRGTEQMEFNFTWLRDHCRCSDCFKSNSWQRLIDPADFDTDLSPGRVTISDEKNNLDILWSDGHATSYEIDWLDKVYKRSEYPSEEDTSRVFWDGETLEASLPQDVGFRDYMESEKGVTKLLGNLRKFGIAFMSGVPANTAMTRVIGERVHMPLKASLYGGDVENTANLGQQVDDHSFDDEFLPLHADFPSQYDPSGYIMFHYLKQSEIGGETIFSDSLRAARILRKYHPGHYEALATLPVSFHKRLDNGIFVKCTTTIFDVRERNKDPVIVRSSNDDRSVLQLGAADAKRWYAAWHHFRKIVVDPSNVYVLKCMPGRAIFFDNWRLAHGRLAFKGERVLEAFNWSRDLVDSKMRIEGIIKD